MSEEERKFLEIVDLKKGFGSGETRQEVLRGMNFSVAKGEFCVLLGPSGSGKSTLLNIIGGIDSADSGYISINGDKLKDMSEKKLTQYRRKHLGYVFQMYNLIANLNVKENIEVGAYLSDNALDIDELLHTLGLYEHRYKLPNTVMMFSPKVKDCDALKKYLHSRISREREEDEPSVLLGEEAESETWWLDYRNENNDKLSFWNRYYKYLYEEKGWERSAIKKSIDNTTVRSCCYRGK